MNFGKLLARSWEIVWSNKWLILLGMLIALGSSGSTGNSGSSSSSQPTEQPAESVEAPDFSLPSSAEFDEMRREFQQDYPWAGGAAALGVFALAVLVAIGLAIWGISQVALGGLIHAVDVIEGGGTSSFAQAWSAGWAKGWRLIGVGLLPAAPGWIFLITLIVIVATNFYPFLDAMNSDPMDFFNTVGVSIASGLAVAACFFGLLSFFLGIVAAFAVRAAMLEEKPVFDAYQRGWDVLREHLGQALLLWLIQLGIGIALGLLLLVPGILMTLCCILLPLLWAVNGAIVAFFQTAWTLAYREWTGRVSPLRGPAADVAPAV